jgi:hypothetical protein
MELAKQLDHADARAGLAKLNVQHTQLAAEQQKARGRYEVG